MGAFSGRIGRFFRGALKTEPPAIDPSVAVALESDVAREEVLGTLGLPKAVFTCILNQTGVLDPTITHEGGYGTTEIIAVVEGIGDYKLVAIGIPLLGGPFVEGTKVYIQNGGAIGTPGGIIIAERLDNDRIQIITQDITGTEADGILVNASVRIEVPFT